MGFTLLQSSIKPAQENLQFENYQQIKAFHGGTFSSRNEPQCTYYAKDLAVTTLFTLSCFYIQKEKAYF
jgi:hypothetical protein